MGAMPCRDASTTKCWGADALLMQATNWMRTSLPRIAEIVELLRAIFEDRMHGAPRRATRVASDWDLPGYAWTDHRLQACKTPQDMFVRRVSLYNPWPDFEVLEFPDASRVQ